MNRITIMNEFFTRWIGVALIMICLCPGTAGAVETQVDVEKEIDSLSALQMAEGALIDTLYYNFHLMYQGARKGNFNPCF